MACGLLLVALAAADLVQAHRHFNPTLPRDRYYPVTASLDWLREQASETRLAPVDTAADLIQGHVWGMYGLSTVTGFDFHGDTGYQHYMRLAQEPTGVGEATRPATWSYVGLNKETLDLRMLGVLGVRYIVAAPVDVTPRAGGYAPIGPMVGGRTIHFTVPVRHDGVRGIDLLAATYARPNRGRWHWQVADANGQALANGSVEQSTLRDNEWWRLAWPPVERSAGSTLTLTLRSEGSDASNSATLLATATPSPLGTTSSDRRRPRPANAVVPHVLDGTRPLRPGHAGARRRSEHLQEPARATTRLVRSARHGRRGLDARRGHARRRVRHREGGLAGCEPRPPRVEHGSYHLDHPGRRQTHDRRGGP